MYKYYYCKRMRMLQFFIGKGFEPVSTLPDKNNPIFNVWTFDWNERFDSALKEYLKEKNVNRNLK